MQDNSEGMLACRSDDALQTCGDLHAHASGWRRSAAAEARPSALAPPWLDTGCKSYVGLTTLRRTWLYDRLYGTRDYRKHGGLGQLLQIRARTCSSLVARWSLKAPAIAPTKLFVQLRYLPAPCCSAAGERRIRRIVLLRSASKSRLFRHSRSRALASDMKSSRRPDRGDSARMNVVGEDSLMSRNGETDTGNQILLLNHVRHSAGSGCTTKVRTSSGTVPFGECDRASAA